MHTYNLTDGAQDSDGQHSLSDVNLLKAMYVVNYLNLIVYDELPCDFATIMCPCILMN